MNREQIAALLKERGVRPTQQRIAVYEYLQEHRTHPSAEMVYDAVVQHNPTFSRTTVYNSLHALVDAGLVLELSFGTGEKHYDGDVSLHGHFSCLKCGSIADFPLEESVVRSLQPARYTISAQHIHFSGLCPQCGGAAV